MTTYCIGCIGHNSLEQLIIRKSTNFKWYAAFTCDIQLENLDDSTSYRSEMAGITCFQLSLYASRANNTFVMAQEVIL